MADSIFLSIDLDFWLTSHVRPKPDDFLDKVVALGLPIHLTRNHKEMVPWIEKHKADHIVNMDNHPDMHGVARDSTKDLTPKAAHEGDLFDHISWRREAKFTWLTKYPYISKHFGQKAYPWDWGYTEVKNTSNTRIIQWANVIAVAIAVCPSYSHARNLGLVPSRLSLPTIPCHGKDYRCKRPCEGKNCRAWDKTKLAKMKGRVLLPADVLTREAVTHADLVEV